MEQNKALDCCEAMATMENMIAAINVAIITTIASKLKMKQRHCLVSKDLWMQVKLAKLLRKAIAEKMAQNMLQ